MNFLADDPLKIPRNHIRFVNEEIGYVLWVGCTLLQPTAVLIGRSGMLLRKHRSSRNTNYDMIRMVNILPDGTGNMLLNLTGNENLGLKTQDYGRHWSAE